MKYYETVDFKSLDAKWKQKLKKSGFEDIEQPDGLLKIWASYFFKVRSNGTTEQAKEEYYRLAGHLLYDHKFPTARHKAVWELHAIGQTLDEITAALKSRNFKMSRDRVYKIIKELSGIMVEQCRSKS